MNTIVLLFLLGVVLLAGEVFMPGAVLGILGGLLMAAGCVLSFLQLGSGGGTIATFVALALLGTTLYVELVWLPKTKFGRKLVIHAKVAATSQPALAEKENVVGKTAEALTPLVPSGYVVVDGRRYEAYSRSGHIAKGTLLRVTDLDNFRLIVTKT
jgi:membrane-bound ClpP family serine protease